MSYDLYFWRQTKDLPMKPAQIVDALAKGTPMDGVTLFPREKVRELFKKEFPDMIDENMALHWEGAGSYFQVHFAQVTEKDIHMMVVNCGYSLLSSEATMNRIIDVGLSLGCALYDPQTGKRYDQPESRNKRDLP